MLCEIHHFVFHVGEFQGCDKPSVVVQNATGPHSTHLIPRSESWTPWHVFGACLLEFAGLPTLAVVPVLSGDGDMESARLCLIELRHGP